MQFRVAAMQLDPVRLRHHAKRRTGSAARFRLDAIKCLHQQLESIFVRDDLARIECRFQFDWQIEAWLKRTIQEKALEGLGDPLHPQRERVVHTINANIDRLGEMFVVLTGRPVAQTRQRPTAMEQFRIATNVVIALKVQLATTIHLFDIDAHGLVRRISRNLLASLNVL